MATEISLGLSSGFLSAYFLTSSQLAPNFWLWLTNENEWMNGFFFWMGVLISWSYTLSFKDKKQNEDVKHLYKWWWRRHETWFCVCFLSTLIKCLLIFYLKHFGHRSEHFLLIFYLFNPLWNYRQGGCGGFFLHIDWVSTGDPGLISGSGRSTGEGNDQPLQYPCLENPMDWGAWWAAVHGITKSQAQLSG